jgi:hypothetical protein
MVPRMALPLVAPRSIAKKEKDLFLFIRNQIKMFGNFLYKNRDLSEE